MSICDGRKSVLRRIPFAVILETERDPFGFRTEALDRESVSKLSIPPKLFTTMLDVVMLPLSTVFVLIEGTVMGVFRTRRDGVYCIEAVFCPKRRLLVILY
jgi:hypothetical protein